MHNTWPGGLNLPPVGLTAPAPTPEKLGKDGEVAPPKKGTALPVGPDWFAESILHGRPYKLQAIVTEGNPILGSANTAKVREAYKKLEFYVYTGLFMEEAAYFADVILPVCSGLEMEGVYMRRDDRAIRWQHAAAARVGESKTDIEIWIDLAGAMAKHDKTRAPGYWTDNLRAEWKDYGKLWAEFVAHTAGHGRHDPGAHGEAGRAAALAVPDGNEPRR